MPVLRILISFVVVAFGLLFAVFMLAVGILSAIVSRVFGRPAPMPQFRSASARPTPRPPTATNDDAIEVETTPVKG